MDPNEMKLKSQYGESRNLTKGTKRTRSKAQFSRILWGLMKLSIATYVHVVNV